MTRDPFDDFRAGYIAAALFSTSANLPGADENDDSSFADEDMGEADMAPSTLAAIDRDCRAFLAVHRETIAACAETHKPGSTDDSVWNHAGRDFWFTREGHGCGFWDGDWPKPAASALSDAARAFGPADWYTGDDMAIYQAGAEDLQPEPGARSYL